MVVVRIKLKQVPNLFPPYINLSPSTNYLIFVVSSHCQLVWPNYTKYCIRCHMALYATLVTFLMTLLIDEFTSHVIPIYSKFIHF